MGCKRCDGRAHAARWHEVEKPSKFGVGKIRIDRRNDSMLEWLLPPWLTVRDAICDLPDPERYRGSGFSNHVLNPGARSYVGHTGSPIDEVAKTLKAGDHGVPGGENMLTQWNGAVRYFTVREAARMQTFPEEFLFESSWSENMRQLGNAVPVELSRIIASDIRRRLASQHRSSGKLANAN